MWHLRMWFNDERGVGASLMVGLDDLRHLFQLNWFYDKIFIQTTYRQRSGVYPPKTAETKLSKWAPVLQQQWVRQQQRKKQAASPGALWNRDTSLQRSLIGNSNLLVLSYTGLHHFSLLEIFQNYCNSIATFSEMILNSVSKGDCDLGKSNLSLTPFFSLLLPSVLATSATTVSPFVFQ